MASFHFLECVRRGDMFPVARQLQNGANVNMNYCGISPLQLAIEVGDEDMVAFLLHWKAHTTTADGKSMVELAEKMGNATITKLIKGDEKLQEKYVDKLVRQMEVEAVKRREQGRKDFWKNIVLFIVMVLASIAALHAANIFSPELANRIIPRKLNEHLHTYSPFLGELTLPPATGKASRATW